MVGCSVPAHDRLDRADGYVVNATPTAFSTMAPREDALLPGGTLEDPVRRRALMAAAAVIALGLGLYGASSTTTSSATALWVATGVGVPLGLVALRPRGGAVVLVAALALLVPLGLRTAELVSRPGPPQEASHDGGVHVTRAAAEDVLAGRNPYTTSYADDLPDAWAELQVVPGQVHSNPVVDHMPYLPGAFVVAIPGVVVERVTGVGGDPRWVMGALVAGALVALARRPEALWARAAAVVAFGSSFVLVYASWGTNDAAAAALVILAMVGVRRHPGWAGLALALAVSYKAPLVLGLVPWALWEARHHGWIGALRRWWTFPVALTVTCVPFLLWSPSAFVDDTVDFWLGRGPEVFPASGLGLGYRFPDLMAGPVGLVLTIACALVGLAAGSALARRVDHEAVLPVAAAVVLLGLFVPARTFQPNYLALVTGLLATGWLLASGRDGSWSSAPQPERSPTPPAPTSSRTATGG